MQFPWAVPGTVVVCIKDKPWFGRARNGMRVPPRPGDVLPKFMQQYTIREIGLTQRGDVGLLFQEFQNPPTRRTGREPLFPAKFFRPLEILTDEIVTEEKEPVQ